MSNAANGDGDGGASYAGSMKEARVLKREAREWASHVQIVPLEVKPTKAGIIAALNLYAGHPDNG